MSHPLPRCRWTAEALSSLATARTASGASETTSLRCTPTPRAAFLKADAVDQCSRIVEPQLAFVQVASWRVPVKALKR